MSSNKTQKWSSSSSLTKILSRITRTLSFSSKKQQQQTPKNGKIVQPTPKNEVFIPKSVPVIRRYPQPITKILYNKNDLQPNHQRQGVHVNMHDNNNIEEEEEEDDFDYSRYSLRPNLSLFNISSDNLQLEEYYQQVPEQRDWLNDIFHSTKIEH